MMHEAPSRPTPLLVIGLDAADPDLLLQWAARGHLPNLRNLLNRGCAAQTRGPQLISEHGVWTSVFSGISRAVHGYHYFRQLQPDSYRLHAVTGADIDAPPFWSLLANTSLRAAIIDAPDYCPDSSIPGVQICHWGTHDKWDPDYFSPASHPPRLLAELAANFGPKQDCLEKHVSTVDEDQHIHRQLLQHVSNRAALAQHVFRMQRFDLGICVFSESHAAGHQFWKYRDTGPYNPAPDSQPLSHAMRDVYAAIDAQIPALIAAFAESPNVVILSSVGLADYYPTTHLIEDFCRKLGYQPSPPPSRPSLRPIDLARRLLPESLRIALSSRLPRARREAILADQFINATDWSRTTAFSVPVTYTSLMRVNLAGREPRGIVSPGDEYHRTLDRLEQDFAQLVDPVDDRPAVESVTRTDAVFPDHRSPILPDLFVRWKQGSFMQRVEHPKATLTQKRPEFYRVSDHTERGFFAAAGPDILPQPDLHPVEVLDLAPTFCQLLGLPPSPRMTGSPLPILDATTTALP